MAVGAERHRRHRVGVAGKHDALSARGEMPQPHRAVAAGRGEQLAVGAERGGQHRIAVPGQFVPLLAGAQVPKAHRAILARRRQRLAVGTERRGEDATGVAPQAPVQPACGGALVEAPGGVAQVDGTVVVIVQQFQGQAGAAFVDRGHPRQLSGKQVRSRQRQLLLRPLLLKLEVFQPLPGEIRLEVGPFLRQVGLLRFLDRRSRLQVGALRLAVGTDRFAKRPCRQSPGQAAAQEKQQGHGAQQRRHGRVPPHPFGGALHPAHRPSEDRLARPKASQILGQRLGAGIAAGRHFLEAFEADGLDVLRHPRVQQPGRDRFLGHHLHYSVERRCRLERRPAGQAFIQDCPQGINVARGPQLLDLAIGLLGSHVARCAQDGAGRRHARGAELPCQAEVGDLGRAVLREQHVGRLEVAVQDALLMGDVHRPRQHLDDGRRLAGRQRRAAELFLETAARAVFQRIVGEPVVLADLVDLDDIAVLQPCDRLPLGAEALQVRRAGVSAAEDHLERHHLAEPLLPRPIDHPHAASAQHVEHGVAWHVDAQDGLGIQSWAMGERYGSRGPLPRGKQNGRRGVGRHRRGHERRCVGLRRIEHRRGPAHGTERYRRALGPIPRMPARAA